MADLLVERSPDVLRLRLNRPDSANALAPALVEELIDIFEAPGSERLVVMSGEGRMFCAGFDLSDIESLSDGDLLWRFVRIEHLLQLVHHSPRPVVCLAHRHVVGAGADLFAASTLRVVSPGTSIRMPGLQFDVVLGTRRLASLVGRDAAVDILLDTRPVGVEEAERIGLVTNVAEPNDWPAIIERARERAVVLSPLAQERLLAASREDTRAEDMAALVASAGRPGLRQRIETYRRSVTQQKAGS